MIYVSAQRGDFPKTFASLYGRKEPTPMRALVFEGLVASALLLPGSLALLINIFSVSAWLFYFMAASVVLTLRWKQPNLPRPFKYVKHSMLVLYYIILWYWRWIGRYFCIYITAITAEVIYSHARAPLAIPVIFMAVAAFLLISTIIQVYTCTLNVMKLT